MTLIELESPSALADIIKRPSSSSSSKPILAAAAVVITFSAHWCGPCRATKPTLENLAIRMKDSIPMGIVYEDTLGNMIHDIYHIRAFPTHVLFVNGIELQRIEGANISAVDTMIQSYLSSSSNTTTNTTPLSSMTGGETLGSGSNNTNAPVLSLAEARLARLAKLGVPTTTIVPTTTPLAPSIIAEAMDESMEQPPPPQQQDITMNDDGMTQEQPMNATTKNEEDTGNDIEMVDAADQTKGDDNADAPPAVAAVMIDPTTKLNSEHIQTLTETMGFTLIRAQKGLLYGTGNTVEGAIEWLMEHQDDITIDEPIPLVVEESLETTIAQSYKCNECGKILSNMANLELHANKTGHSDFEESTECIRIMTPEEKIAKIAEIKQLLKLKRTEREEAEKVDDVEREIQRRQMGKEMAKTKEQLDADQRKRDAMLRKKEKADFARERERLREELARDKAERASGKGKLSSRLGVDGYKPDGIQYDVSVGAGATTNSDGTLSTMTESTTVGGSSSGDVGSVMKAKKRGDPLKIDEYIKKISSYRAGGDGGNCLRILLLYIGNVVDNPTEEKYKTIKMDNKTYRMKVKPFIGAKDLLLACGFVPPESGGGGDLLVLPNENVDIDILTETKTKLESAYEAFNK